MLQNFKESLIIFESVRYINEISYKGLILPKFYVCYIMKSVLHISIHQYLNFT